jgi:hypothetical protein
VGVGVGVGVAIVAAAVSLFLFSTETPWERGEGSGDGVSTANGGEGGERGERGEMEEGKGWESEKGAMECVKLLRDLQMMARLPTKNPGGEGEGEGEGEELLFQLAGRYERLCLPLPPNAPASIYFFTAQFALSDVAEVASHLNLSVHADPSNTEFRTEHIRFLREYEMYEEGTSRASICSLGYSVILSSQWPMPFADGSNIIWE